MSDKFPQIAIKPVRTNFSWHGRFPEAVFSVFTNPATAYAALHRYLRPLGGDVADLGVETSVLSNAYITYSLLGTGGPIVRLRLERLEVAFLDWSGDVKHAGAFVDGLRAELGSADRGLTAHLADVSFDIWASVQSGSYAEWSAKLVTVPESLPETRSRVSLYGSTWSLGFEPAARFTEGVYVRYTRTYSADVPSAVNATEGIRDLWEALAQFGVVRG